MVCLGNICRSPLAEGILHHYITTHQLDWVVDSAGTGGWHAGEPPDPRSIAVARRHGIDLSSQKARKIEATDFANFDLIVAMDTSNYRDLLSLAPQPALRAKVRLLLDFLHPGKNESVPDPYWDDNAFEPVFQLIAAGIKALAENLTATAAPPHQPMP